MHCYSVLSFITLIVFLLLYFFLILEYNFIVVFVPVHICFPSLRSFSRCHCRHTVQGKGQRFDKYCVQLYICVIFLSQVVVLLRSLSEIYWVFLWHGK